MKPFSPFSLFFFLIFLAFCCTGITYWLKRHPAWLRFNRTEWNIAGQSCSHSKAVGLYPTFWTKRLSIRLIINCFWQFTVANLFCLKLTVLSTANFKASSPASPVIKDSDSLYRWNLQNISCWKPKQTNLEAFDLGMTELYFDLADFCCRVFEFFEFLFSFLSFLSFPSF